ncbi:MAG: MarR family transcriptional regulator, partial [Ilumatobacteraceae bacterium]
MRGHHGDPSISEIAEHLLLRHHSVVELINRAVAAGLVARVDDPNDHRVARVRLTVVGADKVALLASAHLEELSRLRSNFQALWSNL